MRQFRLSMQNIYQQSELHLIDPSVWRSYVSVICGVWSQQGPRETWLDHSDLLDATFVVAVEDCETR